MGMDNQLALFRPTPKGKIRYARLETSPRLQRLLAVLKRGGWWSTRALVVEAEVMAVSACVTELRANGIAVESRCVARGHWEYRVTEPTGGN